MIDFATIMYLKTDFLEIYTDYAKWKSVYICPKYSYVSKTYILTREIILKSELFYVLDLLIDFGFKYFFWGGTSYSPTHWPHSVQKSNIGIVNDERTP